MIKNNSQKIGIIGFVTIMMGFAFPSLASLPQYDATLKGYGDYNAVSFRDGVDVNIEHKGNYQVSDFMKDVLDRNLLVSIQYNGYAIADSDYQQFKAYYSPYISSSFGYTQTDLSHMTLPATAASETKKFEGNLTYAQNLKGGLAVATGLTGTYKHASTSIYSPTFFVQMEQKLLKNAFGGNDIRTEELLGLKADSDKLNIKKNIAGLTFSTMYDQFQLIKKYRDHCDISIKESVYEIIKGTIKNNVELGVMEAYTLNQFNSLIYGTMVELKSNASSIQSLLNQNYFNLMAEENSGSLKVLSLDKVTPGLNETKLLEEAYANRADYLEALNNVAILQKQLTNYKNETLPELNVGISYALMGEDADAVNAAKEIAKFKNASTEIKFTYKQLLDDRQSETKYRDVQKQLEQATTYLTYLKKNIENEVQDSISLINTLYDSYVLLDKSQKDAVIYVESLIIRLKQAKVSTVELKDSVDMLTAIRMAKTEILVAYNISLINMKVQTNTLFEDYGIDIDEYISMAGGAK